MTKEKMDDIHLLLAGLKKTFGDDSVCILGEDTKLSKVETRSSGSLALDLALGGGWGKGRVACLSGAERSGKCVTADTYVLTTEGYKTIEQIFAEAGISITGGQKDIECRYPLVNRYGEVEYTSHFTINGERPIYKVTTENGLSVKVTGYHPLLTLDPTGVMVWRYARDIKEEDVIVSRIGDKISGNLFDDVEEAFLLGLLIADGCFSQKGRIGFTNNNPDLQKAFKNGIKNLPELHDCEIFEKSRNNTVEYQVNSMSGVESFYKRHGIVPSKAEMKEVPQTIMNGTLDVQKAFLSAYFECGCHIQNGSNYHIEVISASQKLIQQVSLLLRNLGIVSTITRKTVKGYEQNDYYRLFVFGEHATKFVEEIGFVSSDRKNSIAHSDYRENFMAIPGISQTIVAYYRSLPFEQRGRERVKLVNGVRIGKCECNKDRLCKLLNSDGDERLKSILSALVDSHLCFEKVTSIEQIGREPTFDVCMPHSHSFIANSMVVHNTSILCLSIAEAQVKEPDKLCAVIDLENTFNPEWATKLGVQLDKLIFSQPDKPAEEVYDMIENMLKSGKFSIIGLDSLAGLVPKEEFESDEWDKESRVGGASKINSRAVRKLVNTGLLSKSGTSLILINQLRDLIGGYSRYGVPTTTTGGRSLKHCYTHHVEVSIGEYFSEGSDKNKVFIGQQIVAKVSKNKIGPPLRRAVLNLYYEEGLDHVAELVTVARMVGVLHGAGAWLTAIDPRTGELLTYNDSELKFNGREKARIAINEDIENNGGGMYSLLMDKVIDVIKTGGNI